MSVDKMPSACPELIDELLQNEAYQALAHAVFGEGLPDGDRYSAAVEAIFGAVRLVAGSRTVPLVVVVGTDMLAEFVRSATAILGERVPGFGEIVDEASVNEFEALVKGPSVLGRAYARAEKMLAQDGAPDMAQAKDVIRAIVMEALPEDTAAALFALLSLLAVTAAVMLDMGPGPGMGMGPVIQRWGEA